MPKSLNYNIYNIFSDLITDQIRIEDKKLIKPEKKSVFFKHKLITVLSQSYIYIILLTISVYFNQFKLPI